MSKYRKQKQDYFERIVPSLYETDYPKWRSIRMQYQKMPRLVHHDNKDTFNIGGSIISTDYLTTIRVPKLTASRKTWKNFYNLYPFLKGKEYLEVKSHRRFKHIDNHGQCNFEDYFASDEERVTKRYKLIQL